MPGPCAVAKKMTRMVEMILRLNPDVKMVDSNGYTCLHEAVSERGPDSHRILDMLLAAGAELSPLDKFGRTPMEVAVGSDNLYAAHTLIKAGAPVPADARKMAEDKNKEEFMKLFKEISSESKSEPEMAGAASLPLPQMTIAEEKEALLKRLAELEEKEKSDLESQLKDKKEQLEIAQKDFRSQKSKVQKELDKLDAQVTALRNKLSILTSQPMTTKCSVIRIFASSLSYQFTIMEIASNLRLY